MIKRIKTLIKRNINALKLGIPVFAGIGKFKLPKKLLVNGKTYEIEYYNEDMATSRLVFIEIFLDDCYNLSLIKTPVKKIIDIGANMGFASLNILLRFNPDFIVCYEPNSNLIPILTKNCSNAKRCVVENKGVGKVDGKASLDFIERDSEIVTGLTKTSLNENGTVLIDSFNSIIDKYDGFDLVKMDCEGAEWDFISDDKWKKVKFLTMEYHLSTSDTSKNLASLHASLKIHFNIIKELRIDNLTGMILAKNKSL